MTNYFNCLKLNIVFSESYQHLIRSACVYTLFVFSESYQHLIRSASVYTIVFSESYQHLIRSASVYTIFVNVYCNNICCIVCVFNVFHVLIKNNNLISKFNRKTFYWFNVETTSKYLTSMIWRYQQNFKQVGLESFKTVKTFLQFVDVQMPLLVSNFKMTLGTRFQKPTVFCDLRGIVYVRCRRVWSRQVYSNKQPVPNRPLPGTTDSQCCRQVPIEKLVVLISTAIVLYFTLHG